MYSPSHQIDLEGETMKHIILITIVFLLSTNALAIFLPNYERPILHVAEMDILETHAGFETVNEVSVVLNQRDNMSEPTSVSVKIVWEDGSIEGKTMRIYHSREDSCGSVIYIAQIADSKMERYSIVLTDNSNYFCEYTPEKIWEAHIRHGFDFNGTMDDSMDLIGTPQPTYSIL